jgi:hypothetical protein
LTAKQAVTLAVKEVVRLHGVPDVIVHDRDPRFTAGFWKEFWRLWSTRLGMSTAFHPQTDGQSERENRTLGVAVRSFVKDDQTDWDEHLPLLELAMNSAVQSSTGVSPFMMMHGREAVLPVDVQFQTPLATSPNPAVEELHGRMRKVWEKATRSIEQAKARQKKAANSKRRAAEYQVGDEVLLSTENIQMVGANEFKRSVKFAAKFIGPFKVSQVVNANAYRLELPDKFGIHPVVNISRLKKFVNGAQQFPSREVEEWRPSGEVVRDANGELEFEVDRILAQRGGQKRKQYLVKWKGYPLWEATWEKEDNLENSQQKLREFRQRVESKGASSEEQLAAVCKGVESVTVPKGYVMEDQQPDKEYEELKGWVKSKGFSLLNMVRCYVREL